MTQKRVTSMVESVCNVGSGFLISLIVWRFIVAPLYDIESSIQENVGITGIFTAISVLRGYIWRRLFNRNDV